MIPRRHDTELRSDLRFLLTGDSFHRRHQPDDSVLRRHGCVVGSDRQRAGELNDVRRSGFPSPRSRREADSLTPDVDEPVGAERLDGIAVELVQRPFRGCDEP